jgi:glucose-6-phosphate dehydrogenase assembly protein OpcA
MAMAMAAPAAGGAGDAGASEVIVLRAYGEAATDQESLVTGLLLPDAPVVAWWPDDAPDKAATSPIGRIATRRITDAVSQPDPIAHLRKVAKTYTPGDSDFAWTRLTLWRAQIAAALDQPPFDSVLSVEVTGANSSPSTDLLAAWFELKLKVPVKIVKITRTKSQTGIRSVKLIRKSGDIEIIRDVPDVATLLQPNQPTREVPLPMRSLRDCLSEDLRRLDPDELFGKVVKHGFGPKAALTGTVKVVKRPITKRVAVKKK